MLNGVVGLILMAYQQRTHNKKIEDGYLGKAPQARV